MINKLLNETITIQVREVLEELNQPVQILLFSSQSNYDYCESSQILLEEITELSDKVYLDVYDIDRDKDLAARYKIDKAPGFSITRKTDDGSFDYGVRFYGIPAGYEFNSLIQSILLVASQKSGLDLKTRDALGKLKEPIHLQVFATSTGSYCPQAVLLAYRMALESPWVEAKAVEAAEFPELAERFNVSGVPQITINHGSGNVVGAAAENNLLKQIKQALNPS